MKTVFKIHEKLKERGYPRDPLRLEDNIKMTHREILSLLYGLNSFGSGND
jgi:hypothetical protein